MPATAEELMAQVHNLYAALGEKKAFKRHREHVQKLNVTAGDHCLYTDRVEAERRVTVTAICSLATCSGVDLVTLARGFMHNIFEIKKVLTPGDEETTCAEGVWILGPGEYMQACFEGVPEGCDLHLFTNGTFINPLSLHFGLPVFMVIKEEEAAVTGYYVISAVSASSLDIKLYHVSLSGAATLIGTLHNEPSIRTRGLGWDGTNLYLMYYGGGGAARRIRKYSTLGVLISECEPVVKNVLFDMDYCTYNAFAAEAKLSGYDDLDGNYAYFNSCSEYIEITAGWPCFGDIVPIAWKSGTTYYMYRFADGSLREGTEAGGCTLISTLESKQDYEDIAYSDPYIYALLGDAIYVYDPTDGSLLDTITITGITGTTTGIVRI